MPTHTHDVRLSAFAAGLPLVPPEIRPVISRLWGEVRSVLFPSPLRFILRWLPPGSRVLDVGCGNGDLLIALRERGYSVVGFEVDAFAAQIARARGLNVVVAEDLGRAGFPANRFDLVIAHHVLEHVDNPGTLLTEIWRLCAPGGVVLLAVPYAHGIPARLFGPVWTGNEVPRHRQFFALRNLCDLVARTGFELEGLQARPLMRPSVYLRNIRLLVRGPVRVKFAMARVLCALLLYPLMALIGIPAARSLKVCCWSFLSVNLVLFLRKRGGS